MQIRRKIELETSLDVIQCDREIVMYPMASYLLWHYRCVCFVFTLVSAEDCNAACFFSCVTLARYYNASVANCPE